MPKKIFLNENNIKAILFEEFLNKNDINNIIKNDKELEKRIKTIAIDTISELFRILWQRKSFYNSDLKK